MRCYVASKFENRAAVREAMQMLIRRGFTITHDWTVEDEGDREGHALLGYLRACAQADIEGVRSCDVFLLLNHPGMSGAWVEFGLALAWDKKIVIVGGDEEELPEPIFMKLKGIRTTRSLAEAIMIIEEHAHADAGVL